MSYHRICSRRWTCLTTQTNDETMRQCNVTTICFNRHNAKLRHGGFSLLEMIVTLMIVAMLSVAVSQLFNHVCGQTLSFTKKMSRLGSLDICLDMLSEDVMASAQSGAAITVTDSSAGHGRGAGLTIIADSGNGDSNWKIDWVAASHYDGDDLILYRRQRRQLDSQTAMYIPLCRYIDSFAIELFNPEGIDDPNAPPAVMQISADIFGGETSRDKQLLTVNRTFCLRRYSFDD